MSFVSESVNFEGKLRFWRPVAEAFPLFSPRGEEAWVPRWKRELLHPTEWEWGTGLVFWTVLEGQECSGSYAANDTGSPTTASTSA